VALFYANHISITWFAYAQLTATALSFAITLGLNIYHYKKIPLSQSLQTFNFKTLLSKSLPFALLFALMGFYTRMDVLMMKWLLPDAIYHCGIYAQSFRFLDAAAMFAMLFSGLLLPMYARLLSSKEDVRPLTHLAATVLSLVSITVASTALFFGEDLLFMLYKIQEVENLRLSASVFGNIMLAFVPMSLIFVFSTLLTAQRDLKYLNWFAFAALTCNLVLNLILIPKYQSLGASISSLTTQSLFAVLCIVRCFYLFDFKLPIKELLKYLGFIMALFALYLMVKGIDNLLLSISIFGVCAIAVSFLLKILDIRQLLITFKRPAQ
jgi:O-antigen/teichoic acid export membrane protein